MTKNLPGDAVALCDDLVQMLAAELRTPENTLSLDRPLTSYGLDSLGALMLAGDIEDRFGIELPSTLLWDYPTIRQLAGYLQSCPQPAAAVTL